MMQDTSRRLINPHRRRFLIASGFAGLIFWVPKVLGAREARADTTDDFQEWRNPGQSRTDPSDVFDWKNLLANPNLDSPELVLEDQIPWPRSMKDGLLAQMEAGLGRREKLTPQTPLFNTMISGEKEGTEVAEIHNNVRARSDLWDPTLSHWATTYFYHGRNDQGGNVTASFTIADACTNIGVRTLGYEPPVCIPRKDVV